LYKKITATIAVPALVIATAVSWAREDTVRLTVLDLNDGMSVFVDAPGQRGDVLVDGGGDWSGTRVVVPFLRAQGVDQLAATILTRADKAHAAGLSAVAGAMPVGEAIHSGVLSRSKFHAQWLAQMQSLAVPLRKVRTNDEFGFSDEPRWRVLYPPPLLSASRSDDNSLVLELSHRGVNVLMMSDAGASIERWLVEEGKLRRAHVIVKGRHGSEPSCTEAFLAVARPELVVQVVGFRPSGRYAEPELAERLARRGARYLRTDDCGAVQLALTGDGYSVHTQFASRDLSD
jgi:competence protein ComEC